MTIAISLKVNDGVVLASDSATTMTSQDGQSMVNVYNNANKIFNLRKGYPIGAVTWGHGSFGPASVATLAKDFRSLISAGGSEELEHDSYTMENVAERFVGFMYDHHYGPAFKDWQEKPLTGFVIAGYSARESVAEEWTVNFQGDTRPELQPLRHQQHNLLSMSWEFLDSTL